MNNYINSSILFQLNQIVFQKCLITKKMISKVLVRVDKIEREKWFHIRTIHAQKEYIQTLVHNSKRNQNKNHKSIYFFLKIL